MICFETGGNIEFIKQNKSDIFKRPETFRDENNKLRIKTGIAIKCTQEFVFLLDDQNFMKIIQKKLLTSNNYEDKKNELKNALKQFVKELISA